MATTEVSSEQSSEEMEFLIAADLTLYQNPLNSALNTYSPKPKSPSSTSAMKDLARHQPTQDKTPEDANRDLEDQDPEDWIASDMTKYDSPLADLEKQHGRRMEDGRQGVRTSETSETTNSN